MKEYVYLFDKKTGAFDKHVNFCGEHLAKQEARRLEWAEKWPNHCRKCEGAGAVCSTGDLVPYGLGVVLTPDNCDPCPDCIVPGDILKMMCPRCGNDLYEQVVFNHRVPQEDNWLIAEYGQDGIVESWLEKSGHCPVCEWEGGQGLDDFAPSVDGCICNEVYFYGDDSQPGFLQRVIFKLFGERWQSLWSTPIIIYRR